MSGITDLPVELIHNICSFLRPTCVPGQRPHQCRECTHQRPGCVFWYRGQIDVSRLSRACKRLRDVVQPLLFLCSSDNGGHPARRLVRLLRTLLSRPDLAHHVRYLMFYHLEHLSPSDTRFIQSTITDLGLPPVPDSWNTDGEPEYRLLPLELVLAHTPNLNYLRFPLDYDWQLNLLPRFTCFSLPSLRSLEVTHYFIAGDRFDASLSAVETIISAAPNLQSLSLPSPNDDTNFSAPLANLRRLDLQANNSISPELLTTLISSASKLVSFSLHWDALGDAYEDCEDRRVVDAWDAISRCKSSLEELLLDIRNDTELGEAERDNLKDFEKLEAVKVDGHSLGPLREAWLRRNKHARVDGFLSGFFPVGIREVTLWNLDGVEMRGAVRRFARVVAVGRYPRLKRVVLGPGEPSDRRGFDEWRNAGEWRGVEQELGEEFGRGGVGFEVRWTSPSLRWEGLE
ncbi:hypothetical protein QBC36DRAFT_242821 [Triangularia setosa]|uniref:Uncharacterized protein n=1 Tax=Triangularia setosa TaxID=2587417 RepID=A0AAN7A631_9PEZI|nr:hypothetical protein QBC36DRAFT_242821 [Podospora setosa]